MIVSKAFIDAFGDYLGSPDWLSFVAPAYAVQKPRSEEFGVHHRPGQDHCFKFHFRIGDKDCGHLDVLPYRLVHQNGSVDCDTKTFWINGVGTHGIQGVGLGREYVRRAVMFASQLGYTKIATSIFSHEGSSFWLGLGFRSDRPVKPDWEVAGQLQEAAAWQQKIHNSPDALWDLARTEFGQRVLFNRGGCGVLDLNDQKQRQYAFDRLRL